MKEPVREILKTKSQLSDSSAYWKEQFDRLVDYVRPLVEPQNSERLEELGLRLVSKTNLVARLRKAIDNQRERAERAEAIIKSATIAVGRVNEEGELADVTTDAVLPFGSVGTAVRVACIVYPIEEEVPE